MKPRSPWIGVTVLLLVASLAHAQGADTSPQGGPPGAGEPRGVRLTGDALDARTKEVASLLRCPVCQGLSVADSPATMAVKMKVEVREMLAAGYDQDQILAYFEKSYGEFVRLKPPLRGVNWLVWIAPLMGLVLGGAVVAWALRAPKTASPAAATEPTTPPAGVPEADAFPSDPKLAAYVLKARELAYGWPGGVRPQGKP
jgi:cytochrome c-type biogenesis protein CcmH